MARTRQQWEYEQGRLLAAYPDVRARLTALPGVLDVGVGLRRRGREYVHEPVFVVTVEAKRPPTDIPGAELVPAEIDGFPTDVVEHEDFVPLTGFDDENHDKAYTTLVGGIQCSADGLPGPGTLGCLCRDDVNGGTVILSNYHVLVQEIPPGGQPPQPDPTGHGVGQPEYIGLCGCVCSQVAAVNRGDWTLDAAIAPLKAGQTFHPKIRRIRRADGSVEQEGLLLGTAAAVMAQEVFKVGARTGLTRGEVVLVVPRVRVKPLAPFTTFADRGDSGSVIVEKAGSTVIALLNRVVLDTTSTEFGVASGHPIAAIQASLQITLLVSDPAATYSERDDEDEPLTPAPVPPLTVLSERLRSDPAAAPILALVDRHSAEIRSLLARRRRFTVAWHRSLGPTWIAAFARTVRDPLYRVPQQIDGIARDDAVRMLRDALRAEGSVELVADLDAVDPRVLAALVSAGTLDDALARMPEGVPV